MSPDDTGVAAATVKGVRWNYVGSLFSMICSLFMTTVLARILGPGPFGEVLIASTVYGFINLFVNGGFTQALIQKEELPALQVRRTFTAQLLLSVCLSTAMATAAPYISVAFRSTSAVHVVRVMSLIIVLQALGLVSSALLRRQMRYAVIQQANICSYIVSYIVVGLPLALGGAGVWSLVAAYLSQALITTVYVYAAVRHPLKLSFYPPDREIRRFGSAIVGTNVVNWGHSNLDNVAAGRLGPASLGTYGRVCNLAYQPVTATITILQPVLLSSSARLRLRPELLRGFLLACLALASGVLMPAYITFALVPETVMLGLYGRQWAASIPLVIPMALAMPLWGIMGLFGPVLAGLGKPQFELWTQTSTCVLAATGFFLASKVSLEAIAWVLFLICAARCCAMAEFACRLLHIRRRELTMVLLGRLLVAVPFAALMLLLDHAFRLTGWRAGTRLISEAVISGSLLCILISYFPRTLFGTQCVVFLRQHAVHLPSWVRRRLAYMPGTLVTA